ncbi:MAG: hypothetical protein M3Z41_10915 [Candidatus Eremiobacteraeota bacterium]|nr:hypothetical protein [Candidatus Eremiobacteraeota bacterium]
MNSHLRPFSLLFASLGAVVLMGASNAGSSFVPPLPMTPNEAMIFNPGTGDFAGFRIVVDPSGRAIAIDGAGRASNELQSNVVQKFFADLASAGPLDKLPGGNCSSAKPDTSTTTVEVNAAVVISWNGQKTPALRCASDPRATKILLDATTIQHALYVQAYRKKVVLAYGSGSGYSGQSYRANFSGYDGSRFYIDRFQNANFSYPNFSSDNFSFSNFNSEMPRSRGPWASLPGASQVFSNLPYSNPFSGAPASSFQTVNPFSGSPYSSFGSTTPFGPSPYGSSPFSSGPSVVTHP